jgi:hypothetical protein
MTGVGTKDSTKNINGFHHPRNSHEQKIDEYQANGAAVTH